MFVYIYIYSTICLTLRCNTLLFYLNIDFIVIRIHWKNIWIWILWIWNNHKIYPPNWTLISQFFQAHTSGNLNFNFYSVDYELIICFMYLFWKTIISIVSDWVGVYFYFSQPKPKIILRLIKFLKNTLFFFILAVSIVFYK